MATKVRSIINTSDVLIPVELVDGNVTVYLPPGEKMENINIENWHSINKMCKTVLEFGEVMPPPVGKQKIYG